MFKGATLKSEASPKNPQVDLRLWPYGGPEGGAFSVYFPIIEVPLEVGSLLLGLGLYELQDTRAVSVLTCAYPLYWVILITEQEPAFPPQRSYPKEGQPPPLVGSLAPRPNLRGNYQPRTVRAYDFD